MSSNLRVLATVATTDDGEGKTLVIHAYRHQFMVMFSDAVECSVIGLPGFDEFVLVSNAAIIYMRSLIAELDATFETAKIRELITDFVDEAETRLYENEEQET